jgi:hypothetical protein
MTTKLETARAAIAAHTPGPWRAKPWSKHEVQIVARVDGKDTLVTGYCLPDDARLIAAAPELLEALQQLYGAIDSCVELTPQRLAKARAAIAKAVQS